MSTGAAGPMDRLATVLATFGFCGFFPVAPATFASAVSAVILYFVYPQSVAVVATACLGVLLLGTWSSGRIEKFYGHDPSAAVIDEVLGMMITLIAVPMTPSVVLMGFAFFRIYDILKVPPGRALEKLPGGWGVMMDDAMAGVYAAVSLQVVLRFWPEPRLTLVHAILAVAGLLLLFVFRKPLFKRFGKKRSPVGTVFGKGKTT